MWLLPSWYNSRQLEGHIYKKVYVQSWQQHKTLKSNAAKRKFMPATVSPLKLPTSRWGGQKFTPVTRDSELTTEDFWKTNVTEFVYAYTKY